MAFAALSMRGHYARHTRRSWIAELGAWRAGDIVAEKVDSHRMNVRMSGPSQMQRQRDQGVGSSLHRGCIRNSLVQIPLLVRAAAVGSFAFFVQRKKKKIQQAEA